jgi:hypothetical protein
MAYEWRDISKLELCLLDTKHLATVALRRDFSVHAAYWVDVYFKQEQFTKGELTTAYYVFSQWNFRRKKDSSDTKGHSKPRKFISHTQALDVVEDRLEYKIDDGWVIDRGIYSSKYINAHEIQLLKNTVDRLLKGKPKESRLTKAERFKLRQQERKSKAEW